MIQPWHRKVLTNTKQIIKALKFSYEANPKSFIKKAIIEALLIPIPVAQVYFAKLIMDQVSLAIKSNSHDLSLIGIYIFIEFLLIIINQSMSLWISRVNHYYRTKVRHQYRKIVSEKIGKVRFEDIDTSSNQDLIYEVQNKPFDVTRLTDGVFSVIRSISTLIAFLGLLIGINAWAAGILLIISLFSFSKNQKDLKNRINSYKDARPIHRRKAHFNKILNEPESLKEIKILNIENKIFSSYEESENFLLKEEMNLNYKSDIFKIYILSFSKCLYYLSYAWAIWLTVTNEISLGDLTMFSLIFNRTQDSLLGIFSTVTSFSEEINKIQTFYDFLDLPEANNIGVPDTDFFKILSSPDVEFKNVCFSYNKKETIKNVCFKLEARSKIAIVGENGAGKSTLIKLICGLYKPSSGSILVGGVDIEQLSRPQLKQLMGVVFQNFIKLPYSFKENITLAQPNHTPESYVKSLSDSGANEVRESLVKGEEQFLNKFLYEDGVDLSGGQWQKIALARAFIQSSKILILDEPTSAIDAKQEYEIFKKFQSLTEGKTSILVSHRFSTVRMAEKILFIENGEIIEQGSHQELIELNGKYAHMFNLQAQGYK